MENPLKAKNKIDLNCIIIQKYNNRQQQKRKKIETNDTTKKKKAVACQIDFSALCDARYAY